MLFQKNIDVAKLCLLLSFLFYILIDSTHLPHTLHVYLFCMFRNSHSYTFFFFVDHHTFDKSYSLECCSDGIHLISPIHLSLYLPFSYPCYSSCIFHYSDIVSNYMSRKWLHQRLTCKWKIKWSAFWLSEIHFFLKKRNNFFPDMHKKICERNVYVWDNEKYVR